MYLVYLSFGEKFESDLSKVDILGIVKAEDQETIDSFINVCLKVYKINFEWNG